MKLNELYKSNNWAKVLLFVLQLAFVTPCIAGSIVISSVQLKVNQTSGSEYLEILGANLKATGITVVNFGNKTLPEGSQTDKKLLAFCPSVDGVRRCMPGDWLLRVTTYTNDTTPIALNTYDWNLTVGIAGPIGPIGPQGPKGDVGPIGPSATITEFWASSQGVSDCTRVCSYGAIYSRAAADSSGYVCKDRSNKSYTWESYGSYLGKNYYTCGATGILASTSNVTATCHCIAK